MRGTLSPKLKGFIDTVNQAIAQAKADGVVPSPALAREKLAALSAFVTQSPEVALVRDMSIEHDENSVAVRVYANEPKQESPLVLFFHGGGHMCGDIELYDPMARKIAIAGNCTVASVEYRLAPEAQYPAGLNDCTAVLSQYQQLLDGIAHNGKVIVCGDSAGGAISASLAHKASIDSKLTVDKQILIYPSLDYTMSYPSIDENGEGYFLEKARIDWYFQNYFADPKLRKPASPLWHEIGAMMPDTHLIVSGCDPLRDEALAYAERLSSEGCMVAVDRFDNMIHAFMNIEDLVTEECERLFSSIGKSIKQLN
jgi:acetyl esterase/lipase